MGGRHADDPRSGFFVEVSGQDTRKVVWFV